MSFGGASFFSSRLSDTYYGRLFLYLSFGCLATKTGLLGSDPILWFAFADADRAFGFEIMTLPVADEETDDEKEKMSVAKSFDLGFLSSLSLGLTLGVALALLCYIAPHLFHHRREFEGIGMG